MPDSYVQEDFLRVFADGHKATANRIVSKIAVLEIRRELIDQVREIVRDEIRGLYHGNLVVLDGGSSLANRGVITIVDDHGTAFVTHLHEIGFAFYDDRD